MALSRWDAMRARKTGRARPAAPLAAVIPLPTRTPPPPVDEASEALSLFDGQEEA